MTAQAKLPTTTTLTSSANPAVVGQPVTFTAQVTPSPNGGMVTFFVSGAAIGTAEITSSSRASLTFTPAAPGPLEVYAVFGGSARHGGSTSAPLAQTVVFGTTTTVTVSANPAVAGESITVTATVSAASATGTVTFMADGQMLGTAPVVNGQATLTVTLEKGKYKLSATYSGDASHTGSTSASLALAVNKK